MNKYAKIAKKVELSERVVRIASTMIAKAKSDCIKKAKKDPKIKDPEKFCAWLRWHGGKKK